MSAKKTTEPKTSTDRIEKFDRTLKVTLTDAELLAYGQELAEYDQQATELENELAAIKKEMQGKIEVAQAQVSMKANLLRQKYEFRGVKCERIFKYAEGIVLEIRCDTGETVNHRPMTDDERQQTLPLEQ